MAKAWASRPLPSCCPEGRAPFWDAKPVTTRCPQPRHGSRARPNCRIPALATAVLMGGPSVLGNRHLMPADTAAKSVARLQVLPVNVVRLVVSAGLASRVAELIVLAGEDPRRAPGRRR